MKCAVIDIGSNSIRLSVYETEKNTVRDAVQRKIMAGLGGYVNRRGAQPEGIDSACNGLLIQKILNIVTIDSTFRFLPPAHRCATSRKSLDEAVRKIKTEAGFDVKCFPESKRHSAIAVDVTTWI